jgi:NADPH:quinone reductase-like Zn-dependent oxidoreductase
MKAWRLEGLGGALTFEDVPLPEVRPHSVLIRMEAVPLLSYLKDYVAGKLPAYRAPAGKFTPGTNGVGIIEAVGDEVWQLKVGQRVVFSPYFVASENVQRRSARSSSNTAARLNVMQAMVVFNDPVPVEEPALQAVLMALEMREAISGLTGNWREATRSALG